MKPRPANQNAVAMTLTEVLVSLVVLAALVLVFLPAFLSDNPRGPRYFRIRCVSNLRQIGIAYRIWAEDNNGNYPMQTSVTNGGAMELTSAGNVASCFQVLSNVLGRPEILVCPADKNRILATSFAKSLTRSNISYFVGLDAMDTHPQTLLSGDDNLVVNGTKVRSGILNLHTNDSLAWTGERHGGEGNIGLADGSVQELDGAGLTSTAGLATNRLAIP
jgi:prepilin-type processing-associated H-X9-DG protein